MRWLKNIGDLNFAGRALVYVVLPICVASLAILGTRAIWGTVVGLGRDLGNEILGENIWGGDYFPDHSGCQVSWTKIDEDGQMQSNCTTAPTTWETEWPPVTASRRLDSTTTYTEPTLSPEDLATKPPTTAVADLEVGGEYQFFWEGEYHLFNPETASSVDDDFYEYCLLWKGIRNEIDESGGSLQSAEEWTRRIAWTEQILDLAPVEYREMAATYLGLVKARAELLAQYDYVGVRDLPSHIRTDFIEEHFQEQQISNVLIDFSTTTCLDGN